MGDRDLAPEHVATLAGVRYLLDDAAGVARVIEARARRRAGGAFHFVGGSGVDLQRRDEGYRAALHEAAGNAVDGAPVALALRIAGHGAGHRAPGPDVTRHLRASTPDLRHLVLCADDATADAVRTGWTSGQPAVAHVMPWVERRLDEDQLDDLVQLVRSVDPDLVWIGLSTPKQDLLALELARHVDVPLLCVGAAVEFNTGRATRAPRWMRRAGLEWLHRLVRDPGRLWRRYLRALPAVVRLLLHAASQRLHRASPDAGQ